MRNDIAIKIEGLGKRYRYGGAAPIGDTLRSDITEWARGLWPRRRPKLNHGATENAERTSVSTSASAVETASHPLSPSVTSVPSVVNNPPPSSLIPHHSSLKEIHEDRLAHDPSYFWALRDINLEVRQGEACPPKFPPQRRRILSRRSLTKADRRHHRAQWRWEINLLQISPSASTVDGANQWK